MEVWAYALGSTAVSFAHGERQLRIDEPDWQLLRGLWDGRQQGIFDAEGWWVDGVGVAEWKEATYTQVRPDPGYKRGWEMVVKRFMYEPMATQTTWHSSAAVSSAGEPGWWKSNF